MRSQSDILARIQELDADGRDYFGFERGDLISSLTFENAKPFLKEGATEDQWTTETEDQVRAAAIKYLDFAYGKAEDHRGLSASRSVSHFGAWLWLLELLPDNWDDIPHENYGVPALFVAAEALGLTLPHERKRLTNMGSGLPCSWDCEEGCGR